MKKRKFKLNIRRVDVERMLILCREFDSKKTVKRLQGLMGPIFFCQEN